MLYRRMNGALNVSFLQGGTVVARVGKCSARSGAIGGHGVGQMIGRDSKCNCSIQRLFEAVHGNGKGGGRHLQQLRMHPMDLVAHHQSQGALGLYPVWQAGFLKLLFPEIGPAVRAFMDHGDWDAVEQARQEGWRKAREAAQELEEILTGYQGAAARTLVRRVVMEPLVGAASPRAED